jgi:proline dehydrogenase
MAVDAFEVQMLYGIRTDEQRRLAAAGYRVRDLISYGEAWYAWYLRRLAERPANVWFALRQIFSF